MIPFAANHQVFRLGESRHPLAIFEHGVPANMIEMEMGADYGVDRFAREARLRELIEKRQGHLIPFRETGALLVIADAGVDEDAAALGLHEQRMDAQKNLARLVEERR